MNQFKRVMARLTFRMVQCLMSDIAVHSPRKTAPQSEARKRAKAMPRSERRKQLLAAARKIVAKGGVTALTMTALSEATGVSKPVVYEHFDNWETVAIALLDDYFEAAVEAVDTAARGAQTLGEYLQLAVDAEFDFQSEHQLSPWGITNGYSASERLNQAYRNLQKITLETFEDLLVQQGVKPDVAKPAGFVLAGMLNNAVYEFASRPNNLVVRETVKTMMSAALAAVVPLQTVRPATPEKTLETYRRIKEQRED